MDPRDKGRVTRILNANKLNLVFDLAKIAASSRAKYFYGPRDRFEAQYILKFLPMLVEKAVPILKTYNLHSADHWKLLDSSYPEVKKLKEQIKDFKELWNVRPIYR